MFRKMSVLAYIKYSLLLVCLVSEILVAADNAMLEVKPISQNPDYPTGCELISAVMVLDYYGYDITAEEFEEDYLLKGSAPYVSDGIWYSSNPNELFLGDPKSEKGWGIWSQGLAKCINNFLADNASSLYAEAESSLSLESLCFKYVRKGIPVIVWCTVDMAEAYIRLTPRSENDGSKFAWVSPNHCMVLVGYDSDGYYFNDPLTGKCRKFGKMEAEKAFYANNSQSVVLKNDNSI